MSWVTVVWSVGAGACLTLAAIHIVVWWRDRTQRANLVFSVMAVAVARVFTQWGVGARELLYKGKPAE